MHSNFVFRPFQILFIFRSAPLLQEGWGWAGGELWKVITYELKQHEINNLFFNVQNTHSSLIGVLLYDDVSCSVFIFSRRRLLCGDTEVSLMALSLVNLTERFRSLWIGSLMSVSSRGCG